MRISTYIVVVFSLVFFQHSSFSQIDSDMKIRQAFFSINGDLEKADKIYNLAIKQKNKSNVFNAYLGALQAMLAGKQSNPLSKLSWFNKGTAIIEKSIKNQHENPEIHFLRLSIQLKAPSFLFYNGDIDADKKFVIKENNYFDKVGIKNKVNNFLLDNADLSSEEKIKLNK